MLGDLAHLIEGRTVSQRKTTKFHEISNCQKKIKIAMFSKCR